MERRRWAARAASVCLLLLCQAVGGGALVKAQEDHSDRSFFSRLSYDAYVGSIYNRYHGAAMGGRIALPVIGSVPTLNAALALGGRSDDDLLLIPGVKIGSINAGGDPMAVRVQYLAPDLSLHYSFLRFTGVTFAAGPALEVIFTNNYRKYLAVPATGVDLGVAFQPSEHFQIGVEQRWITGIHGATVVNAAGFPGGPFSHIGLVMRFSLPWKAEDDARIEYEKQQTASYVAFEPAAANARMDSLESRIESLEARLDSLGTHARALESRLARITERADAGSAKIDRFNERVLVAEPEYVFTRDPFKAGNLVQDGYLKDVLIDILDDDYVWQLRSNRTRMHDAEKIREYFTLYNETLGRRIVLVEDEKVPMFSLKCLGKALAAGNE